MTTVADLEVPEPPPLVPGIARAVSPLVRRIVAPNAGYMTGPGTNTYLVGIDEIVVIDPGPDDPDHLDVIAGCGGDRIRWIVCTHTHPDHAPGAQGLKERTGAPILAYSSRDGLKVDGRLRDEDRIEATEFRLRVLHTPGHASNHVCYLLEEERMLFSGDHIMQGSTVVIRPPDGDMAVYLDSLDKVRIPRLKSIAPGHGHVMDRPHQVIDDLVSHRLDREAQVLGFVSEAGTTKIGDIVEVLYADVVPELHPMARHSVHAHLNKLAADGKVTGKNLTGKWSIA